jgi:branched-chain amino acid transport system substrate-binding protein
MLKKFIVLMVVLMLFCPALVQAEKKYVTFGVVCPTSGPVAFLGEAFLRGIDLAIEEVNTKWNPPGGGIIVNGQRYFLKYEHYNDEANPAKSVVGFRKLIDQYKVPFILGPLGTPQSWGCSPISKEKKVLFDAFSASDKTRRLGNPYLFQSRPPGNYMGAPMAKACIDKGWKKFAVLTDVSDAYKAWGEAFAAEMKKLGGTSVGFEVIDTKTVNDYHSIMTKFNAKKPDVIFINAYEEPNSTMVLHAREIGYKGHFMGNPNFSHVLIKNVGPKNVAGSLMDTWGMTYYRDQPQDDPTGIVELVYNKYKKKYGDKPWHNLVGNLWDQALHFIKAMEVAQSVDDALAIRVGLDKAATLLSYRFTTGYDGVLPCGVMTGWADILAEVEPSGSIKKVGELIIPTETLKVYKNADDSPLYKLLKAEGRYDEYKQKGLLRW